MGGSGNEGAAERRRQEGGSGKGAAERRQLGSKAEMRGLSGKGAAEIVGGYGRKCEAWAERLEDLPAGGAV